MFQTRKKCENNALPNRIPVTRCGDTVDAVSASLMVLELHRHVIRLGGGGTGMCGMLRNVSRQDQLSPKHPRRLESRVKIGREHNPVEYLVIKWSQ